MLIDFHKECNSFLENSYDSIYEQRVLEDLMIWLDTQYASQLPIIAGHSLLGVRNINRRIIKAFAVSRCYVSSLRNKQETICAVANFIINTYYIVSTHGINIMDSSENRRSATLILSELAYIYRSIIAPHINLTLTEHAQLCNRYLSMTSTQLFGREAIANCLTDEEKHNQWQSYFVVARMMRTLMRMNIPTPRNTTPLKLEINTNQTNTDKTTAQTTKTCDICYSDDIEDKEFVKFNCSHSFCKECVVQIISTAKGKNKQTISCAFCRTEVKNVDCICDETSNAIKKAL